MKTPSLKKAKAPAISLESESSTIDRKDWLRVIALIFIATVCWCYITGRTSVEAWQVPLEYGQKGADGDATGFLAHIKEAQEGDLVPFHIEKISRQSAPYSAVLSDRAITEKWQLYLPGVLARFIGIFAAANAAVLVAQVLACVCFYLVARLLDCKWWWAFAGGITFGFAQFALARSLHHLNVTNYWYVPFCLLIADWMSRDQMGELRGRRFLYCVLGSFLIGMQNPYYTNVFLQLVLLGAFYQYFRQGWKPVIQAGGIVVASAAGFFLMNIGTFAYHFTHGPNPDAAVREFKWLELSALKCADMLVPPPNHSLFGALGDAYYNHAVALPNFPEVPPSCYLGLLGIAAFVWLTVVSVRRLVGETARNLPLEAWQTLWIVVYSIAGGLNCLLGIFGVTMFRSTTRYCIFILPILLLFAIRRLSKQRMDPEVGIAAAGLCALLALWDQTPPVAEFEANTAELRQVVDSDREFTQKIEAQLPKGAMIFQVPIMEFPESPAPGMPSYDHFRPYLHSTALRFSFGGIKGRPWLKWQQEVGQHSLPDFIHAIESYGFAAVYVNRHGFPDKGEGLLKAFRDLGYNDVVESKVGDLFCVMIHPNAHPILPAGTVN